MPVVVPLFYFLVIQRILCTDRVLSRPVSPAQAQEVVALDSAERNPMPVATLESVDENSKRLLESLGKLMGRSLLSLGAYVLGSGPGPGVGYHLGFGPNITNLHLCVVNSWQTPLYQSQRYPFSV